MRLVDENLVYSNADGLWVSGLFGAISGSYPGISFHEQKEIFFWLILKWLKDGLIVFCSPDSPLDKPWEADAEEILEYLKGLWPERAVDENDLALTFYFHEIPALLWVGKDGGLYGS